MTRKKREVKPAPGGYVVVCGNPGDGFTIYGDSATGRPFEDANEAGDWAGNEMRNTDPWWVMEVQV